MHNLTEERVDQVGSLWVGDKKYPVFEGINTVGRDPNCDIFLNDITISKNHAEIKARPKSAFVCDLRSSNKTRLNNEVLRPLRFYQVVDDAEITFGLVNARYLFLRDIDNEIIVPETPAFSARAYFDSANACKKKLNHSLICESDDDSVIQSTQPENNDSLLFAVPSPRNRRSPTKIANCNVQVQGKRKKIINDIHNVETQQIVQSENIVATIHDCETQQLDDGEDIHTMQTQKVVTVKKSQQSIHDMETQQLDDGEDIHIMQTQKVVPVKNSQPSIHDMETQKSDDTEETKIIVKRRNVLNPFVNLNQSIHELETQQLDETEKRKSIVEKKIVLNPFVKLKQSIHELETQKLDIYDETQHNPTVSCNVTFDNHDDIFTAETQPNVDAEIESSTMKVNKAQCKERKDAVAGKKSNEVNKKNEKSNLSSAISETSQNKTSDLIIDETDDESETDEEGTFSNIQTTVKNCNESKNHVKQIHDSDSETDEDGEFATLEPNWSAGSANFNKKIAVDNDNAVAKRQIELRNDLESPCLNERFVDQISIQNDEIINSDDDELAENINNSKKIHHVDLLNKNRDCDDRVIPTTPKLSSDKRKSGKLARKSLNKTFISDDDGDDVYIASTQIIPIPELKKSIEQSSKVNAEFDDDDDLVSTQIIQSPKLQKPVKQPEKANVKSDNIDDVESSKIILNPNDEAGAHENDEITVGKNILNTSSENNLDIDNDMAPTQMINVPSSKIDGKKNQNSANPKHNDLSSISFELSENISNKGGTTVDNYCGDDDDSAPTQVVDVQMAKIQAQVAFKKARNNEINNKNNTNNQLSDKKKSNNAQSPNNKLRKIKHSPMKKSRMSLRLQRNLETSTAVVEEQPNKSENLNDSISENLENLFGKENKVDNFVQPAPLATQQLQDILEHSDNNTNKICSKIQAANKLNDLSSPDTDSQEYFNKLHSKRKRRMVLEDDDTTDSEGDINTSTADNIVYEAGTSGFEKGVAVISEMTIGVQRSPVKEQHKDSIEKAEVKSTVKKKVNDEGEEEDNNKDDLLKGLPEVRIYGTASYPASPTSSVCSLDDWEPYERKRIESLKAKITKRQLMKSHLAAADVSSNINNEAPIDDKLSMESKDIKKSTESSDDEELSFEDLKKIADRFMPMKTKDFSIKLEKISDPKNYRSIGDNITKQEPIKFDDNSHALIDKRRRGRPKKINDYECFLEEDKNNSEDSTRSIDDVPQIKRARLREKSADSSSSSLTTGAESQEVQAILEVGKRVRKVPEKFRDKTVLSNIQQTPSKPKKSKSNILDLSSSPSRSRLQHKVMLTGVSRIEYEPRIKQCGGIITDKPEDATVLVTDKIRRTNKFFCAITRHIPIVSVEWIDDSTKEKSFLDWQEYLLKDPAVEAKYKFSLKQSLERAATKKLLNGFTFIVTSKITQPSVEELKSMIQMSGGKALVRPPKLWISNTIIITCLDDTEKVKSLLSKVPNNLKIPVFSSEFILSGILKQELNFDVNCIQI